MPSLNEEKYIETALDSIRNQSYADNYELILVDSGSTDSTVEIGSKYVDMVIKADKGKLLARNVSTQYASGDIIVSVDADTYYPEHWLVNLLQPFEKNEKLGLQGKSRAVGVIGPTKYSSATLTFWEYATNMLSTRMGARNCAYYKDVYLDMGGLNEEVDKTMDVIQMVMEEEIMFGIRLKEYGKVVLATNAWCQHLGDEKVFCRFPMNIIYIGNEEKKLRCDSIGIGVERF